jgi:nicotinate-nucleotide adenylyltransferase
MKITTFIYGGTFNPPTLAHEAILKACIEYARKLDADVWLIPSGNRVDKQISVSRGMRIKYIDAMLDDIAVGHTAIKLITTELDRNKSVETFDTLQEFTKTYPNRSFIWVFGADAIETMSDWGNGQWLLDNLNMLIAERQGSIVNPLAKKVIILDVKIPDISSTEVRRHLDAGEPIDNMVGKSVNNLLDSTN